jgi:hypothetical protein
MCRQGGTGGAWTCFAYIVVLSVLQIRCIEISAILHPRMFARVIIFSRPAPTFAVVPPCAFILASASSLMVSLLAGILESLQS